MKSGILTIIVLTLTGLLFFASGILTAADIPDTVVIETEGYKKDKKGPVNLSHLKHSEEYEVSCDSCHHEYTDGQNVWKEGDAVQKCGACHDPNKSEGDVKKLQTSFHKNCKDCHKEVGGEAPSTKCNDCHAK
ncbi:cytochrome c family protein [Deltaproteobacteria bacterium]|nr:cytochrome c family protein [Deltaproteobacteria bacterium]